MTSHSYFQLLYMVTVLYVGTPGSQGESQIHGKFVSVQLYYTVGPPPVLDHVYLFKTYWYQYHQDISRPRHSCKTMPAISMCSRKSIGKTGVFMTFPYFMLWKWFSGRRFRRSEPDVFLSGSVISCPQKTMRVLLAPPLSWARTK